MSRPVNLTLPVRCGTSPMIARSVVVLPAPLRPMTQTASPAATVSDTPCRMWLRPYQALRSRTSSIALDRLPEIDAPHLLVRADVVGRALGEEPSVMQDEDAVRDAHDELHAVLDEDHGALLVEPEDQVHHGARLLRAHAGGRLVEEEKPRVAGERDGDLEAALVAVGEVLDRVVAPGGEADRREELLGARDEVAVVLARRPDVETGLHRLRGDAHVLEHAELREQVRDLERLGDPEMGEAVLRLGRDVAALEADPPGARRERAGDEVEEGALAGAVRPDDRGQAAGEEARGHVGERREAAESFGEPLDDEDRGAYG